MAKKATIREKLLVRRVAAHGPQAPCDEAFFSKHPMLGEFLTRPLVYGGRVMEMPRLTISLGDGDWQASLSDGVLCQSTTVRAATFDEAIMALELSLSSGDARWSQWKGREPRLPKPKQNGKATRVDNDQDAQ